MDRELEVIRDDMEQTRASLADKLGALENQVRETVSGASEVVSSTVEDVKEVVSGVTDTVESVTETFNISKQVEQNPWAAVGIAVAAGAAAGYLLGGWGRSDEGRRSDGHGYRPEYGYGSQRLPDLQQQVGTPTPYAHAQQQAAAPPPQPQPSQRQEEGLLSQAASMLPSLESVLPDLGGLTSTVTSTLGGLAVGSVMNVVRELVVRGLPQEWHGELNKLVDQVTHDLGGKQVQPVKKEENSHGGQNDQDRQHGQQGRGQSQSRQDNAAGQQSQEESRGRRPARATS